MEQLRQAGASVTPARLLQWLIAAVPYALGWLLALLWAGLVFLWLAALAGWRRFYGQ